MRLDPALERALDETGLPWSLEKGKRHWHVRLAGRLAVVLSYGRSHAAYRRNTRNAVSHIRRLAAAVKETS